MPTGDVDIAVGRRDMLAARTACVAEAVGRISGMAIAARLSAQGATRFTVADTCAEGEERLETSVPGPVTVSPAELVR